MTRTPYALAPAPDGVPELMMLFLSTGLPAVTSTPVVLAPPGPVIVMFAIVPLAEASTPPVTVVVPPWPPETVMPGWSVKPPAKVPLCTRTLAPVPTAWLCP